MQTYPSRPESGPAHAGPANPPPAVLVTAVVMLMVNVLAGAVLLVAGGDLPGGLVTRVLAPSAAGVACAAAPLAVLIGRGEVDLSAIGVVGVGTWAYAQVDSVGLGLLIAALAGLVIGTMVGGLRVAIGAPPAVLSLAVGLLAAFGANRALGGRGQRTELIDGWAVPVLLAMVIVGLAIGAAFLLRPGRPTGVAPSPDVTAAYALAGVGSAVFGAISAGRGGLAVPQDTVFTLLVIFAAIGVGGVVVGFGWAAPLLAAGGALATQLLLTGLTLHWSPATALVVLGVVTVLATLTVYGVVRTAGGPPPGLPFGPSPLAPVPSAWSTPTPPPPPPRSGW